LLTGKTSNLDYLKSLDGDLSIHKVSITDLDALHPVFAGVEVVFHQAALPSVPLSVDDPIATHDHCTTGTLNVLVAAKDAGVRRVVYAASSSAYGDVDSPSQDETLLPDPISPYGVAKLAGEYYCKAFYAVYGLETVCLRYFNVFGTRQDPNSQYAAVIPKFITMMLEDKQPMIFGDGSQTRDFTYVDNIVHGNLLAADAPDAAGKMMNMATGNKESVLDLVHKINSALGTEVEPIFMPARAGDILHSAANIDKARELLDFSPIVEFNEGLKRTAEWYRTQHNK
ncbi:MAG: NAD-dependent epimerase/dehydratase family protein, partial [Aggregatilineales bacterium]